MEVNRWNLASRLWRRLWCLDTGTLYYYWNKSGVTRCYYCNGADCCRKVYCRMEALLPPLQRRVVTPSAPTTHSWDRYRDVKDPAEWLGTTPQPPLRFLGSVAILVLRGVISALLWHLGYSYYNTPMPATGSFVSHWILREDRHTLSDTCRVYFKAMLLLTNIMKGSRDISVGIATGYTAGFCFREICLFSLASRPALGPAQSPIQWVPETHSPGGKVAALWSWPLTSI
jgi:hypothetical protein